MAHWNTSLTSTPGSSHDQQNTTTNITVVQNAPQDSFHYSMVYVPTLLLLGLFGNSMTLLVVSSQDFSHMAMSDILIALSLSDSALIIMSPLNKSFFLRLLPLDPRSLSLIGCKLFFWAWRTAKMTSSWLVVLISLERFVAVWFPMKASTINTKRNAVIGISLVYLLIGSYNFGWAFISDRLINGVCIPNQPTIPEYLPYSKMLVIIGTLVYSVIPSLVIAVFNSIVIAKLISHHKKRKRLLEGNGKHQAPPRNLSNTTVMLVTLSVSFVLLVVPIGVGHSLAPLLGTAVFNSHIPSFSMFIEVAQSLEQLNYSVNFFLYVACSERFRKKARAILTLQSSPRNKERTRGNSTRMSDIRTSENSDGTTNKNISLTDIKDEQQAE